MFFFLIIKTALALATNTKKGKKEMGLGSW